MVLQGFPADHHEFASHWHTARNLDVNQSFEWTEFAGARDGKAQQKLFERILAAYIFHGSLRAHGGRARQDEHGARRIQAFHERDYGVVFHQRLISGTGKDFLGLTSLSMDIADFYVPTTRPRGALLKTKFLIAWDGKQ